MTPKDTAWERGKAYTAMLADAAKVAAAAAATAAAAAGAAAADVLIAQSALAAAQGAAATWTAVEALAAAEAALVAAEAVALTAAIAAKAAAAAVAAATAGTLIGQGLRGLWTLLFEILAVGMFVPGGAKVYSPMSQSEADLLLPDVFYAATGAKMSREEFEAAGSSGEVGWEYTRAMTMLFVNASRAAAVANAGNREEFLGKALPHLDGQLRDLPETILDFSHHLESACMDNGGDALKEAFAEVERTVTELRESIDETVPESAERDRLCGTALLAMRRASKAMGTVPFKPAVGVGGYIPELDLETFRGFIADCEDRGAAAIPDPEIELAKLLLRAAGILIPDVEIGPFLAQYDAEGDNTAEEALFKPRGSLSLADYLRRSALQQSDGGRWLGIDPANSPLAARMRGEREVVDRIEVADFDSVIGEFRLPARARVRSAEGGRIEVERPTSIREVAIRHARGDVGRLLEANPRMLLPVRTIRGFLDGRTSSGFASGLSGEMSAGALREITSGVAFSSSSSSSSSGAGIQGALATLLGAIADASGGSAEVITSAQPFNSSSTDEAVVLMAPETVSVPHASTGRGSRLVHHDVGHDHAPEATRGSTGNGASPDAALGSEALGVSIDGSLPAN